MTNSATPAANTYGSPLPGTLELSFIERIPPCVGPCPAGTNPREFVRLTATSSLDDIHTAFNLISEVNPLVSIIGHVCYRPCQISCFRRRIDDTVSIASIERFVGDTALEQNWDLTGRVDLPEGTAPKAMVIGSGPSGLSAAYQLRRHGIRTDLFEFKKTLGGMMRQGITRARLPLDVLDGEIERLERYGIHMHTGMAIKKPAAHFDEYDAVVLCGGGGQVLALVPGLVLWNQPAHKERRKKRNVTSAIGRGRLAAIAVVEYFEMETPRATAMSLMEHYAVLSQSTSTRPRMKNLRPDYFHKGASIVSEQDVIKDDKGLAVILVNTKLEKDEALDEARRCMSCGSCFGCDICVEVCPVGAIKKSPKGYVINHATCMRCGICVDACPADALELQNPHADTRDRGRMRRMQS